MFSREKLSRINELTAELSGFEGDISAHKSLEMDLKTLAREVEELRAQRREIEQSPLIQRIRALEQEYEKAFREIDYLQIRSAACVTIQDVETVLNNIQDESVCLEKCVEFLKSLILSFVISSDRAEHILGLSGDTESYTVVRIAVETERLLELTDSRTFHSKLFNEVRSILKRELPEAVPMDIKTFTGRAHLYVITGQSTPLDVDDHPMEKLKPVSVSELFNSFPGCMGVLLSILKDNLKTRIIQEQYSIGDIALNNNVLSGTNLWVENVQEWLLDFIVRNIVRNAKEPAQPEDALVENLSVISGRFISRSYSMVRSCLKLFNKIQSDRKRKAAEVIGKSITRFFSKEKRGLSQKGLFLLYSEIVLFLKDIQNIPELSGESGSVDYTEVFSDQKEQLFISILEISTAASLDLNESPLRIKSLMKGLLSDFIENLDMFINQNMRNLFIEQFFSRLYNKIVENSLQPVKRTEAERACLVDAGQYALELSYEYKIEKAENYCKLRDVVQILQSQVSEIENLFRMGRLTLNKHELRTLLRMFLDQSLERDEFLSGVY